MAFSSANAMAFSRVTRSRGRCQHLEIRCQRGESDLEADLVVARRCSRGRRCRPHIRDAATGGLTINGRLSADTSG
jgi:hypothetical protein